MSLLRCCAVLFFVLVIRCSKAQISVGFVDLIHHVQESSRLIKVDLFKTGENVEEIIVLVTPITFNEFYNSKRVLPSVFDDVDLPDPAEYVVSGKQDFTRSGPVKLVFGPSSDADNGTIEVAINDDSINEPEEGFLLHIRIEGLEKLAEDDDVVLLRGGVALVVIADDDPIVLGFEEPQYSVQEEDRLVGDLVYISKNGIESEQVLRVMVQCPTTTSAVKGEDYVVDLSTEVNINPEEERVAFYVRILDDQIPEDWEYFQLILSAEENQPEISIGLSTTTVNIEDNDVITVGFEEPAYTVHEFDEEVNVCIHIADPEVIDLSIVATLSTSDGTAKDGIDYGQIKRFVNLPTFDGRPKLCCKISIVDDKEIETNEKFIVQLISEVSTASNVRFQPDHVEVIIVDDDAVNECQLGKHNCHENAACIDTYTSYKCMCKNGFTGSGVQCVDIDECLDSNSNYCHELATCTNTEGSYTCSCPTGFSGNGITCVPNAPPDECIQDSDCHEYASCRGRPSGNKCICKAGYSGDGKSCTEIDECAEGSHLCPREATCTNTAGSYFCKCSPGYRAYGKYRCIDVDECRTYRHNCDQHASCTNMVGSFTCRCNAGYTGDGTRGNCRAINL